MNTKVMIGDNPEDILNELNKMADESDFGFEIPTEISVVSDKGEEVTVFLPPDPKPYSVINAMPASLADKVEAELEDVEVQTIDTEEMPSITKEEINELTNARQWGMLVNLSTSQWSGRVKDIAAAEQLAATYGTDSRAFTTHKNLMHGADTDLKRIKAAIQRSRITYYHMTLPWGRGAHASKGARLLPNTLYFEFIQRMAAHRSEIKALVGDFITKFDGLCQSALQNLGTAADPSKYPSSKDIANMFAFDFDFMPIPQGADFSGLPREHLDKLASVVNGKMEALAEGAMKDAWARLYDTLSKLHTRLSLPEGAKLHKSTIEACVSMSDHIGHLNFTHDRRLDEIRTKVKAVVSMYEPKDLQKDDALRKVLADKVNELLTQIKAL